MSLLWMQVSSFFNLLIRVCRLTVGALLTPYFCSSLRLDVAAGL
jgi:hypothetical protein